MLPLQLLRDMTAISAPLQTSVPTYRIHIKMSPKTKYQNVAKSTGLVSKFKLVGWVQTDEQGNTTFVQSSLTYFSTLFATQEWMANT
jgi:hypothetical protein